MLLWGKFQLYTHFMEEGHDLGTEQHLLHDRRLGLIPDGLSLTPGGWAQDADFE